MFTCQKNPPCDSAVPSKLNKLFALGGTIAEDDKAPSRPGSTTLGSLGPDFKPTLALPPPSSTKKMFKQFMQMYMDTVRNQTQ